MIIMKNSFLNWLEKELKRQPNTIKMYKRYINLLPDIDFIEMSEEEITGIINNALSQHPNNVAKSTFIRYIDFLFYEFYTKNKNPYLYEKMRRKKNTIKANIEFPLKAKEYKLDLEQYFISKYKLVESIKRMNKKMKIITLLLYDSNVRPVEFFKNKLSNLDEKGIFIPYFLSKTSRDRFVDWLIPECSDICKSLRKKVKGDTLIEKIFKINQFNYWYYLKKIKDYSFIPYALRHTRLTDLAGEGWELGRLQRRAGHSDAKTTQRYISWASNQKEEIMTLESYCKKNNINIRDILNFSTSKLKKTENNQKNSKTYN